MKQNNDTYWLLTAAMLGGFDMGLNLFEIACPIQAFMLGTLWNQPGRLPRRMAVVVSASVILGGCLHGSSLLPWIGRSAIVMLAIITYRNSVGLEHAVSIATQTPPPSAPPKDPSSHSEDFDSSEDSDFDLGSMEDLSTRMHSRVPLRFRLIDTGIFHRRQAVQVEAIVTRAGDENSGLDMCIKEGLLTKLQAGFIVEGRERDLRVGRYKLEAELGRGSMGVVYRALDTERNNLVALKLFSNRNSNLMMIRREMAVIQELVHPNIVTALEVGDSDGRHFIAMELINGDTMLEKVRRDGAFSESGAIRLCLGVAKALEQAHRRQILHRDVKPGNVMITADGGCKLVDFGICRPPKSLREHDSLAVDGAVLYGTLGFVSPEQAKLDEDLDSRSDIYGLGCTLFFALTGEYHVLGDTPAEKLKNLTVTRCFKHLEDFHLSEPVARSLQLMLAYEKQDRYENATEVVQDLSRMLKTRGELPPEMVVHVLIVESDATDLRIITKLLLRCSESVELLRASSFADADAEVRRHREVTSNPLIVLVDLDLPDSSHMKTIDRFRELSAKNVGVVGLSESEDATTRRACLAAGFLDYLAKNDLSSMRLERAIFANYSRLGSGKSRSSAIKSKRI